MYYCNYDVVWIYERDLFSYYNWPKILFKSIQMLNMEDGGGNLVLRTKDSKVITLKKLKTFFDSLSYLNVTIKNQFELTNNTTCTHFLIIKNKDVPIKKDEFLLLVNKSCSSYKRLSHYIHNFNLLSFMRFLYYILPQDMRKKLRIRSRIKYVLLKVYFAIYKKLK